MEESVDGDFTVEELRLETEVEQALSELEAADAAVAALRMQLENAAEDVSTTRRELEQLKGVVADWEKAIEEGRRELAERERRVEELLAALPPELQLIGLSTEASSGPSNTEEEPETESGLTPRRKRLDIAAERVRVLEGQTARLEETVCHRQLAAETAIAERSRLEQQAEALEHERDSLRTALREARAEVREAETRLKRRDEILVATAQKRQALERQLAHSRAEVNGLNARLTSLAAAKAASEAAATLPRSSGSTMMSTDVIAAAAKPARAAEVDQDPDPELALPGEDARAASLRLQREIVKLWDELRCSEQATSLSAAAGG